MMRLQGQDNSRKQALENTSAPEFVEYYEKESLSASTRDRFQRVMATVLRVAEKSLGRTERLRVLDAGCGAGTQTLMWSRLGHQATGIDINQALIAVARQRAVEEGLAVDFRVGSATALPLATGSFEICLMPELLEHVADWESVLSEAVRVLTPGGVLYLSTTNVLCPIQQEFSLPLYSWYPRALKRRYERLAMTTRPEIAGYAKYPAVNWFTVYGLRRWFADRGMQVFDRFDMLDPARLGRGGTLVRSLVTHVPPLRFLGHVLTPGCRVSAVKKSP